MGPRRSPAFGDHSGRGAARWQDAPPGLAIPADPSVAERSELDGLPNLARTVPSLPVERLPAKLFCSLEGKRIGQQPDSKSGAPKGVGGSNPLPSAIGMSSGRNCSLSLALQVSHFVVLVTMHKTVHQPDQPPYAAG